MARQKTKVPEEELPWVIIYTLRMLLVVGLVAVVFASWLFQGADRSEITAYKVDKTSAVHTTQRMLAAIVPKNDQAWFFKLLGPDESIAPQKESFQSLVHSVQFDDDTPTWNLPSGWTQLPEDAPQNHGMVPRLATLEIATEGASLELSVTSLLMPGDDRESYLLSNINRWRGQLQLPPIGPEQLDEQSETVELAETKATVVDLVGPSVAGETRSPSIASAPPFASTAAGSPQSAVPSFDVPPGWKESDGTSMSKFAYQIRDDQQQVEITVTPLGSSSLLDNVNRWRTQVGLDLMTRAALDQTVVAIDLGGVSGDYVELVGERETILGVVAVHEGLAWFIKLKGDKELAGREQDRFESFVKSFQFTQAGGATNDQ